MLCPCDDVATTICSYVGVEYAYEQVYMACVIEAECIYIPFKCTIRNTAY